jgi:ribosome biogenesis GTPase A
MLKTQLSLVDVVIELLDARVPEASRNPDLTTLARDQKRVLVLNKADLACPDTTTRWAEFYRKAGFFVLAVNAKDNDKKRSGTAKLIVLVQKAMAEKTAREKARGRVNVQTRAMIVGIPNVGKSTFINQLAGKAGAIAADRPGVTRGRQWIKADGFDLLDTPGVLWPKFDDPLVGIKLALTGAISDGVVDQITLANELLKIVPVQFFKARYKDAATLEEIAAARGFKLKGGTLDLERTAIMLIDEFRGGKLGRISLELPHSQ